MLAKYDPASDRWACLFGSGVWHRLRPATLSPVADLDLALDAREEKLSQGSADLSP